MQMKGFGFIFTGYVHVEVIIIQDTWLTQFPESKYSV